MGEQNKMQQSNGKIRNCRNSDVSTAEWWAVDKKGVMGSVNDAVTLGSVRHNLCTMLFKI